MAVVSVITATVTADTQSATIEVPEGKAYSVYQNCTALTSSDNFDCDIEESPDGGTTWFVAASFTQLSGTGKEKKTVPAGHARLIRYNYDVTDAGGGVSATVTHTLVAE